MSDTNGPLTLKIAYVNSNVARLYFTDKNDKQVAAENFEYVVIDTTNKEVILPHQGSYFIVWFDHRPYASELLNSLHWENSFLPFEDRPNRLIPAPVASCTIENKKYHVVPFSDSDLLGSYEPEGWNNHDPCKLKECAVKALCPPPISSPSSMLVTIICYPRITPT